jgi:thymidylate synthase (FAD)
VIEPKVTLMAQTRLEPEAIERYLKSINVVDKSFEITGPSDAEGLIELCGRVCYKAFGVGMNPNITKVRKGNLAYIDNILKSGHGSVLEHVSCSFMFDNVSRIFTHELIRHRAGTAVSQESGRYVRKICDLEMWNPPEITKELKNKDGIITSSVTEYLMTMRGVLDKYLYRLVDLDNCKDFGYKKRVTSWLRRYGFEGSPNSIMFTMNFRALRHILEMRTSVHAEEEMRFIFQEVGRIAKKQWPNVFADFEVNVVDGYEVYSTKYSKV